MNLYMDFSFKTCFNCVCILCEHLQTFIKFILYINCSGYFVWGAFCFNNTSVANINNSSYHIYNTCSHLYKIYLS